MHGAKTLAPQMKSALDIEWPVASVPVRANWGMPEEGAGHESL
jgi:hypothetical protein